MTGGMQNVKRGQGVQDNTKELIFSDKPNLNHKSIIYNKPTRCNSGSIVFIKNYKYALHVSDALCVHLHM